MNPFKVQFDVFTKDTFKINPQMELKVILGIGTICGFLRYYLDCLFYIKNSVYLENKAPYTGPSKKDCGTDI